MSTCYIHFVNNTALISSVIIYIAEGTEINYSNTFRPRVILDCGQDIVNIFLTNGSQQNTRSILGTQHLLLVSCLQTLLSYYNWGALQRYLLSDASYHEPAFSEMCKPHKYVEVHVYQYTVLLHFYNIEF